jgi:high-affinity nickel-transport protein
MHATHTGFGIALLVSAFVFGFRHGIDWDHIAAITDITSSQKSARVGLRFATLYATGHAVVVFAVGLLAIVAGTKLPDSVDQAMGRIVGVTLIFLAVYVGYALIRYGQDFRLRSRWMLLFGAARSAFWWIRRRLGTHNGPVVHEHEHLTEEHHSDEEPSPSSGGSVVVRTRTHTHHHTHTDPFMNYGTGTSILVGVLHGIGAETPTQLLIFLAIEGAGGPAAGVAALVTFLLGLFIANTALAVASASGFLAATKRFAVYATVSVITAVASLALGLIFLFGREAFLPALLGG